MWQPIFEEFTTFNGKTIAKVELENHSEVSFSYMNVVTIYFTDGTKMRIQADIEHTHGQVDDLKVRIYDLD